MKKNFLFGLIGAGALMFSAGVGYSAWTITGGNSSKDDNLSLKADATVIDSHINISESKWADASVEFRPVVPNGTQYKYSWLTATDSLTEENLIAKYHLEGKAGANAKLSVAATFTETTSGTNTYASLVTKKLVAAPKMSITSPASVTAGADGTFTQDITITFAWGEHFILPDTAAAVNPYEFYNSQKFSEKLATDASTNLKALDVLNNCSFKLSLTVSLAQ